MCVYRNQSAWINRFFSGLRRSASRIQSSLTSVSVWALLRNSTRICFDVMATSRSKPFCNAAISRGSNLSKFVRNQRGSRLQRPLLTRRYFPDRRWHIQRQDGNRSHIVSIAIAMGTPMKVPGMPHRYVQKKIANMTTKGEIANFSPARRGSK